jgi:fructose-bisphosphate aldolase class 1
MEEAIDIADELLKDKQLIVLLKIKKGSIQKKHMRLKKVILKRVKCLYCKMRIVLQRVKFGSDSR